MKKLLFFFAILITAFLLGACAGAMYKGALAFYASADTNAAEIPYADVAV